MDIAATVLVTIQTRYVGNQMRSGGRAFANFRRCRTDGWLKVEANMYTCVRVCR